MAKKKGNWIAKATRNKGGLTRAAKASEKNKNGTLNLTKIAARAKRTHNTKLARQVNLAKTLRSFKK